MPNPARRSRSDRVNAVVHASDAKDQTPPAGAAAAPGMTTHSLGASSTTARGSSSATVAAPARSIAVASSRQARATGATRAVGPQPVAARSSSARARASSRVSSPKRAVRAADEHLLRHDLLERCGLAGHDPTLLGDPAAERRDGRLAVGDPAVVDRQPLGHEHAQAGASEPGRDGLEQPPVLEDAAGQHDPVGRRGPRRAGAGLAPWRGRSRCGSGSRRRPDRTPAATSAATARIVSRGSITRIAAVAIDADRVAAALVRGRTPPRARSPPGPRSSPRPAGRTAPTRRRTAGPCWSSAAPQLRSATSSATCASHVVDVAPIRRERAAARAVLASSPAPEPGAGHPPRLADRLGAAGQPHRQQRARPLEAGEVADQELAAPDRAVGAVARCRRRSRRRPAGSPCSASAAARWAWWCWTPTGSTSLALERVLGRQVLGVQVVRDHLGRDGEQPLEVLDAVGERPQRLVVLEVADVMADPGARALGHAEGVLELGAAGQDRATRPASGSDRPAGTYPRERRSISGAAAAGALTTRTTESSVRVWIGRSCTSSRSAMPPSRLERVRVAVGDRLVRDVAAGHHERAPRRLGIGEQQVVERRVGQHHAELGRAGRDRGRHGGAGAAAARARSAAPGSSRARAPRRRARTSAPAASSEATISANGLSSRCLRARSAATAPRRRPGRPGGSRRCP